jgi:hypothetical protein
MHTHADYHCFAGQKYAQVLESYKGRKSEDLTLKLNVRGLNKSPNGIFFLLVSTQ